MARDFRQTESADKPLARIGYDLIQMEPDGDRWTSHFRCFQATADFVYIHPRKNNAVAVIKEFLDTVIEISIFEA